MGPVEAAARSPVPGAALGDLPSSRAARAGGRAGRTAYKHPSSLAGSSLRSQCSFRRVFSGTAHEITPALRLPRPKRVRARLDPIAYFKHGEWRHHPTLARPTTSRSCARGNEARGRRARGARPLAGAAARARPTTGGVMHCNATSENTIVCGRGQIPAAF